MKPKILQAIPEWDDRGQTFRIYLVREQPERDEDDVSPEPEPEPMEAVILGDSIEARLYKAAFVACWKDFDGPHERVLGFEREAAAKRVAKAVNAELKRIAKGEPGPSNDAVSMAAQMAQMLGKKKRR